MGAQHISVHPKDRSIDDDKYETFIDDWQASGILSKDFRFFTPYAGVKGSDCEFVYNINKHDKKRRFSKNHIGLILGTDLYPLNDKLRINIEARLLDEIAFSLAIAFLL